jgi:hypothetical protein
MGEMPMFDESWLDDSGDMRFPDFAQIQDCLDNA